MMRDRNLGVALAMPLICATGSIHENRASPLPPSGIRDFSPITQIQGTKSIDPSGQVSMNNAVLLEKKKRKYQP